MDIKGPADLGVTAPRNERREPARELPDREVSPGVVVEIGRPPELAGTYNARGVLEGAAGPQKVAAPTAPPAPAEVARPQAQQPAMIPTGPPEALRIPANAQVQTLVSASPQVAAALRPTVPLVAPHLHPPALAMTAGIQPLAASALKQAEKGAPTAEHEEEADPLHKEKDQPLPAAGRRQGR